MFVLDVSDNSFFSVVTKWIDFAPMDHATGVENFYCYNSRLRQKPKLCKWSN
jgi:hypothetical protein